MAAEPLQRDPRHGVIGGVCAGIGARTGIDPVLLRVVCVAGVALGGATAVLYLLAWAAMPAGPAPPGGERGRVLVRGGLASVQVALGIGLLVLALLLLFRAWGLWIGDALVWPVTLVAAGAALIWRQSQSQSQAGTAASAERERRGMPELPSAALGRVALGAALVLGGGLVFLWLNDALEPARDAVLAIVVLLVAGVAILAPFWLRLVRGLGAERAARIRSQERAEVAAHLHDSVLQTLALMQKRAEDPRAVAALARRQERELRTWLNGGGMAEASTLAAKLKAVAAEIEDAHGTAVEVVTVGDRELTADTDAVAAAAREALTNAAKFAPDAAVSLYAEMRPDRVEVFVRDRGPGFDPAEVPEDRRGLRESIVGRMRRHGGEAVVHSAPGAGTEVELVL